MKRKVNRVIAVFFAVLLFATTIESDVLTAVAAGDGTEIVSSETVAEETTENAEGSVVVSEDVSEQTAQEEAAEEVEEITENDATEEADAETVEETEADSEEDAEVEETDAESEDEVEAEVEEEEASDEEDTEYPAVDFDPVTVGDTTVTISAPEGAFPEGVTVSVSYVAPEKAVDAVDAATEEEVEEEDLRVFDITFYNAEGKEIEPKCNINVSFDVANSDDTFEVFHMEEGDDVADVVADDSFDGEVVSSGDGEVEISTGEFTWYVLNSRDKGNPSGRAWNDTYYVKKGDWCWLVSDHDWSSGWVWDSDGGGDFSIQKGSSYVYLDGKTIKKNGTEDYVEIKAHGTAAGKAYIRHNYYDMGYCDEYCTVYVQGNVPVYLNANGGTISNQSVYTQNVYWWDENTTYGNMPTPTRTGYTFVGWFKDSSFTQPFNPNEKLWNDSNYTMANTTLYAKWTANTYNVHFDGNGATAGSMADQTFTYDVKANLSANSFSKTGYTFAGWTLGNSTYGNQASVKNLASSGTVTLTAKWTANMYTVNFNYGVGSGNTASKEVTYNSTYGTLPTPNAKTGYVFDGWYTAAEGGSQVTADTKFVTAGNVTLYAHWTQLQLVVTASFTEKTYDGNEKSITTTVKDNKGNEVKEVSITLYSDADCTSVVSVNSFKEVTDQIVYVKATKDGYKASEAVAVKVKITKADAVIETKPSKIDLTYNSSEQNLVAAGSSSTGTMQYKLGENGTYSEAIPTATDAGTYTVYYKSVGDGNHNDSAVDSVEVEITKATPSLSVKYKNENVIENFIANLIYGKGQEEFTTSTNLSYAGAVEVNLLDAEKKEVSSSEIASVSKTNTGFAIAPGTVEGTVYVQAKTESNDNVNVSNTVLIEVQVKNGELKVTAPETQKVTYDGKEHSVDVSAAIDENDIDTSKGTLTITYADITKDASAEYSTQNPKFVNAGTYTVAYKIEKAGYKTVTGSIQFTIEKANVAVSKPTITGWTYNTYSEKNNSPAGSVVSLGENTLSDETVTYKYFNANKEAISGEIKNSLPGTYYVQAVYAGNSNLESAVSEMTGFTITNQKVQYFIMKPSADGSSRDSSAYYSAYATGTMKDSYYTNFGNIESKAKNHTGIGGDTAKEYAASYTDYTSVVAGSAKLNGYTLDIVRFCTEGGTVHVDLIAYKAPTIAMNVEHFLYGDGKSTDSHFTVTQNDNDVHGAQNYTLSYYDAAGNLLSAAPTAEGKYKVRATINATNTLYSSADYKELDFEIEKSPQTVRYFLSEQDKKDGKVYYYAPDGYKGHTYENKATVPTKTGYTFKYWYKEGQPGTNFFNNEGVSTQTIGGWTNLVAKFEANKYTVKFDGNGATGTMADQTFTYDQKYNLAENSYTKTGYTFAGWSVNGETYQDKAEVSNLATEGTITLTAQWTANTYNVATSVNDSTMGTISGQTMTNGKYSYVYDSQASNSAEFTITANDGYEIESITVNGTKTSYDSLEEKVTVNFGGEVDQTLYVEFKKGITFTGKNLEFNYEVDANGDIVEHSFTGNDVVNADKAIDDVVYTVGKADSDGNNWKVADAKYSNVTNDTIVIKASKEGYVDRYATATVKVTELDVTNLAVAPQTTWANGDITLSLDGYLLSTDNKKFSETLTITGDDTADGSFTYYVGKKDGNNVQIAQENSGAKKTYSYKLDKTKPTGTITIANNSFKEAINQISFGMFFKETQDVTIASEDNLSGVEKTYYAVAKEGSTETPAISEFAEYSSLSLPKDGKYVVYAYVVDKAGNRSDIWNSNGVVVYSDSEQVTSSVTHTRLDSTTATIQVALNGNTVNTVAVDGSEIATTAYTVDTDGNIVIANSVLATLAAGQHTVKVTYNPLGVEFTGTENAPASTTAIINVVRRAATVTIGDMSAAISGYSNGTGTVTIEGTGDVTVSTSNSAIATAYMNGRHLVVVPQGLAGTVYVTVSKAQDADYEAASDTVAMNVQLYSDILASNTPAGGETVDTTLSTTTATVATTPATAATTTTVAAATTPAAGRRTTTRAAAGNAAAGNGAAADDNLPGLENIPEEETPLATEETEDVDQNINDSETPLAAQESACYFHWIIFLLAAAYTIFSISAYMSVNKKVEKTDEQ